MKKKSDNDKLLSRNEISMRKVKVFLLALERGRERGEKSLLFRHAVEALSLSRMLSSYITHIPQAIFIISVTVPLNFHILVYAKYINVRWMHTIDSLLFTFLFYAGW